MISFLISLVLVVLLLAAGYATLRDKRDRRVAQPSTNERAAAEAGRVGAHGMVGTLDTAVGEPPAILDKVRREGAFQHTVEDPVVRQATRDAGLHASPPRSELPYQD